MIFLVLSALDSGNPDMIVSIGASERPVECEESVFCSNEIGNDNLVISLEDPRLEALNVSSLQ